MIRCSRCSILHSNSLEECPSCGFSPPTIAGFRAWAPELAFAGGGFQSSYFDNLVALEAENFWFRARNTLILWALNKYFPQLRTFMEVGCGTGFVLSGVAAKFPQARLYGTEVFSAGLAFAAQRVPYAQFMQMDARSIPFEEEFDVVGAFDVIEHIREDEVVLEQLRRAVAPGGGLILTVPQHPRLWSAADEYAHHVRRYSASEIHRKVQFAGFEILRSTSFVALLLPIMLLSRRRNSKLDGFDPVAELRMPWLLNRALEATLRIEQWPIYLGLSWPIGGSRLIVARKKDK